LFNIYAADALEFEATANARIIEFLPQIFPNANSMERSRMKQILKIQTLSKFCHIAENLGATALAFKSSYEDAKSEILGLFNIISNYKVTQINKFYREIGDKDNDYIAKIFGHPPLSLQEQETRKVLERSCRNVRDDFTKIGKMYINLESMYNAYKHSYRLLLGKDDADNSDVVVYIVKGGKEEYVSLKNELILDARKLLARCRTLLDCIFENHRTRLEYEGDDYNIFSSSSRVDIDAKGKRAVKQQLILGLHEQQSKPLSLLYPTRGEKARHEKEIGDSTYDSLSNLIQESDTGKYIALDIDLKKIIAISSEMDKIMSLVRNAEPTGRVYIRKIGADASTGISLY
jgi:hypothetical protein